MNTTEKSLSEPVDVCAGVLLRDGQVLLGKRSLNRKNYPGVWDLPGGHREIGETLETALVRELSEEIGVLALAVTFLTVVLLEHDNHASIRMHVYLVQRWTGEPRNLLVEEHDQIQWVPLEE